MGLGWEGGRLGEGIRWENIRQGEGLPTKLVERYMNRPRDAFNCDLAGVDKDMLSEGQLRKLVLCLESGAKVVNQEDILYVSVLSLGPNGVRTPIAVQQRERPDQKSGGEASERGVEVELPPGLLIGPEVNITKISTRINRRAPDQRLYCYSSKSKSQRGRLRLARLAKKKMWREERMMVKELLRDWLREWPCEDLPTVKKPKRDPKAHHGTEEVTAEVRRMLGRSYKAKVKKSKDSQKGSQEKREKAEMMRRSHKEQELSGSKWKPALIRLI